MEGCQAYLHDIIIVGKTIPEHNERLEKVLFRLHELGLTLNKEKCKFFQTEIEYLGFNFDKYGMHPTATKIKAISDAPAPKTKEELQAFLGLLSFYDCFLKNRSTVAEPLYQLLKKKSVFNWLPFHQAAFEELKKMLSSDSLLVNFNPDLPTVLAGDASNVGVGAVLSHIIDGKEMPIAFASKTLNSTEKNFAQIDKEGLAIIFGVKTFKEYLSGRFFTIYTDHKPLLGIFDTKKAIPSILSPRLLRWTLILSMYDYSINYRRGKVNSNADALSRLPLFSNDVTPAPLEVLLLESMKEPPVSAKEIAFHTKEDPVLSKVFYWLINGWPNKIPTAEFDTYLKRKNELSIHANCILLGNRVVIPPPLRKRI